MPPSAVYAAEDQWSALLDRGGPVDFFGSRIDVPAQRRFADVASVQAYVDAVMGLPWVAAHYPTAGPVRVRERDGQRRAHYEPAAATIAIPLRTLWAGREAVVLHELAHHLAVSGTAGPDAPVRWHGAPFQDAMAGLVAQVLGEPAALLLRAGYDAAGARR
jgi:putative metallohydrolase (TIGR04338 family)